MKRTLIAGIPVLLVCTSVSLAATETDNLARNNLAHDYANCAAFYHVASHLRDLDWKIRQEYQHAESTALRRASALSSKPLAQARYKVALQTVTRDSDPDRMLATAFSDYGYICEDLMQRPKQRMEYWRQKLADRSGG